MLGGSIADVAVVTALAASGTLMTSISWAHIACLLGAVALATLALDATKVWLLSWPGGHAQSRQPSPAQQAIGTPGEAERR